MGWDGVSRAKGRWQEVRETRVDPAGLESVNEVSFLLLDPTLLLESRGMPSIGKSGQAARDARLHCCFGNSSLSSQHDLNQAVLED